MRCTPKTHPHADHQSAHQGVLAGATRFVWRCVVTEKQTLVYDIDLKAPACVLIQAAYGCGASPAALAHFEPKHWITHPTPGMRKIAGTPEEWKKAAKITADHWGDKRP